MGHCEGFKLHNYYYYIGITSCVNVSGSSLPSHGGNYVGVVSVLGPGRTHGATNIRQQTARHRLYHIRDSSAVQHTETLINPDVRPHTFLDYCCCNRLKTSHITSPHGLVR